MRQFAIPGPPADLEAVKDWKGYVWIKDPYGYDDEFTHQFPDADSPARRTWWELIEEGPLTECAPELQNHYI